MKNAKYFYTFLACLSISQVVYGDDDPDIDLTDFSQEQIVVPQSSSGSPFSFDVHSDGVQETRIRKGYYKDDDVRFAEADIELGMVFYYCPRFKEGLSMGLSYTHTLLKWDNNPWFTQNRFNTGRYSISGFTNRIQHWYLRGQIGVNIDTDQWNLNQYANYDLILWGRYAYCRDRGFHIGIIVQTGMKMDRVYPIFGFDWQLSRRWRLNLVFPVNISLEYLLAKNWTFSIAGRTFDSRHRVSPNEAHPRYLIRYQNVGAECAVKFDNSKLNWNVHIGYTLGGDIRIANKSNHHPHHYKLDPSAYAGAEVDYRF